MYKRQVQELLGLASQSKSDPEDACPLDSAEELERLRANVKQLDTQAGQVRCDLSHNGRCIRIESKGVP